MYIDETMNYTVIERTYNEALQALWNELQFAKQRNIICGVIYWQHHSAEGFFYAILKKILIAIALQENRFVF